jgi:hypothetical protein
MRGQVGHEEWLGRYRVVPMCRYSTWHGYGVEVQDKVLSEATNIDL